MVRMNQEAVESIVQIIEEALENQDRLFSAESAKDYYTALGDIKNVLGGYE